MASNASAVFVFIVMLIVLERVTLEITDND